MRADQLRTALLEIENVLAAAGATAAVSDVSKLGEYVEQQGTRDLDQVLAEITEKLDPAAAKQLTIARHVAQLRGAGLSEPRFREALTALRSNDSLDKHDILQVLTAYGVIRISGRSREAYLECLDKHFYWVLYNRDADAMATRATPW